MDRKIVDTDITKAKNWISCQYLDDDLLLIDHLSEAPFPKEPRRMNFILICMCTSGKVTYTLDTVAQELKPGDLLVVYIHHVLDNYNATPDFDGLCMMMSVSFYNEVIRSVGILSDMFLFSHNNPVFPLSERDQETYRSYFYMLRNKLVEADHRFRRKLITTLSIAMLYDLSNVIYHSGRGTNMRNSRAEVIFNTFVGLVEEYCKSERRVSWYAQQLCITPKYLSEMVKQVSMRTPNEWIDQYVTMELRVMLRASSKSIKDIAKEMNFPNQSFLGKYFKERVGMSPSEYRRS